MHPAQVAVAPLTMVATMMVRVKLLVRGVVVVVVMVLVKLTRLRLKTAGMPQPTHTLEPRSCLRCPRA